MYACARVHAYCFALTVTSIICCIIMADQNSCDILDTWYMYSLSLVEKACTYNAGITRMCFYNICDMLQLCVMIDNNLNTLTDKANIYIYGHSATDLFIYLYTKQKVEYITYLNLFKAEDKVSLYIHHYCKYLTVVYTVVSVSLLHTIV